MKTAPFYTGQKGVAHPLNNMAADVERHDMALDETATGGESTIGGWKDPPPEENTEQGFPYGEEFTFGIFINRDDVTIYSAKLYEGPGAGIEISNGDADNNVLITVTENPTYVAAKFVFATDTLTIENMGAVEPYPDMVTGEYYRPLYKFRFSNGRAYMERCLLFDIHLPGTWGRP